MISWYNNKSNFKDDYEIKFLIYNDLGYNEFGKRIIVISNNILNY